MYEGIDVHGDKGEIDWAKLNRQGVSFAFVKATEGQTFNDGRLKENLARATVNGILVGPYHFARPDLHGGTVGAISEARHFCAYIKTCGYRPEIHGRPVLDIEVNAPGNVALWALQWCDEVAKQLAVKPLVYSYTYYIYRYFQGAAAQPLSKYSLWIANYGPNDGTRHPIPDSAGCWSKWVAHQYTSRGKLKGVGGYVDRNYAPNLAPLIPPRVTVPKPTVPAKPDTSEEAMWAWINWWRADGDYEGLPKRYKPARPNVPMTIPFEWWKRLALNLNGRK